MTQLARTDLKVGHTYAAKKPARVRGYINDRQLLHVGMFEVQYDGPAVANGRRYPRIDIDKFLAWAGADVTDQMPPDEWRQA